MNAGRELDALVAEKIMGWYVKDVVDDYAIGYPPERYTSGLDMDRQHIPSYSTDIAAAWQVVEYLTRAGRPEQELYFKMTHAWDEDYGTWAYFDWKGVGDGHPLHGAQAPTAPMAICLAALKAVGVEL